MPKYYCEYCNAPLTHDSPAGRKQHNTGFKHKSNVRAYYANFIRVREQEFLTLGFNYYISFDYLSCRTSRSYIITYSDNRLSCPVIKNGKSSVQYDKFALLR